MQVNGKTNDDEVIIIKAGILLKKLMHHHKELVEMGTSYTRHLHGD